MYLGIVPVIHVKPHAVLSEGVVDGASFVYEGGGRKEGVEDGGYGWVWAWES